jgi:hypothetical protein
MNNYSFKSREFQEGVRQGRFDREHELGELVGPLIKTLQKWVEDFDSSYSADEVDCASTPLREAWDEYIERSKG